MGEKGTETLGITWREEGGIGLLCYCCLFHSGKVAAGGAGGGGFTADTLETQSQTLTAGIAHRLHMPLGGGGV